MTLSKIKNSRSIWLDCGIFFHIFDIVGQDILDVMEEYRTKEYMSGVKNSIFIALIPNFSKPKPFNDYRPISLYNLVYKIIANFISNIIKPVLVKFISKEKFNFLSNRKIMDAIRVSQECLHSIKIKKLKDLILNIDLVKAYDRID